MEVKTDIADHKKIGDFCEELLPLVEEMKNLGLFRSRYETYLENNPYWIKLHSSSTVVIGITILNRRKLAILEIVKAETPRFTILAEGPWLDTLNDITEWLQKLIADRQSQNERKLDYFRERFPSERKSFRAVLEGREPEDDPCP